MRKTGNMVWPSLAVLSFPQQSTGISEINQIVIIHLINPFLACWFNLMEDNSLGLKIVLKISQSLFEASLLGQLQTIFQPRSLSSIYQPPEEVYLLNHLDHPNMSTSVMCNEEPSMNRISRLVVFHA